MKRDEVISGANFRRRKCPRKQRSFNICIVEIQDKFDFTVPLETIIRVNSADCWQLFVLSIHKDILDLEF